MLDVRTKMGAGGRVRPHLGKNILFPPVCPEEGA